MNEITAEQVADWVTEYSGDVDAHLGGSVTVTREGSTLAIKVVPVSDQVAYDGANTRHFRAVVVEGETAPIVFDRAMFEKRINERFDNAIRKIGGEPLAYMPAAIAALREQILNLDVDLAEAPHAETEAGR